MKELKNIISYIDIKFERVFNNYVESASKTFFSKLKSDNPKDYDDDDDEPILFI